MKNYQDIGARKLIDRLVPDDPIRGPMEAFLATTYDLGADFLETDFLPSVFGLGTWDDRSWATRIALEKRLCELDAAVILTEARRYRGRPRSLRVEVRPVPSPRGSALHAKVTLLLFDRAVRLIVGSANLTEPGYRRNREVVAVLTASSVAKRDSALIFQALTGMELALAPWLTSDARKLIRRALEKLQPWTNGSADGDTAFLWTSGQTKLWAEFLGRWPAGEAIKRITILSPFWSEDAGSTLKAFLGEMKRAGSLAPSAEVRLLTDAFQGQDGEILPVLPPGYAAYDWAALGVRATAQPVSPKVQPEEIGGMEGFTGTRALHAKVVIIEGPKNGLAYLGSANFTAHGWGFLNSQTSANIEAGVVLLRPVHGPALDALIPELAGDPILLTNSNLHALRAPENEAGDDSWPGFIRQAIFSPAAKDEDKLELLIEVAPDHEPLAWSAVLPEKEGIPGEILVRVESGEDLSKTVFRLSLSSQTLTRLLTEQEILICWSECPTGRLIPLNIESSARAQLPISPGNQRIEETHLLSYYQGKILWEDLFPDPDPPVGQAHSPTLPVAAQAGVDTSRIQSYQIRDFVEALAGIRADLTGAARSEASMRLALVGPVSPFALAQTVLEAAESERRTPIAAAFQMVEILACLKSAHSFDVPEKLAKSWEEHLEDATNKITHLLCQLVSSHEALARSMAFRRYQNRVLAGGPKAGT